MDLLRSLVFLLCAVVAIGAALTLVTRRNPVYSVLSMLPFFLSLAVLFVMLHAPFLAAMQIMVYGGAILVVFLFVVMLINLRDEDLRDDANAWNYAIPAVAVSLLAGLLVQYALAGTAGSNPSQQALRQAFYAAPWGGDAPKSADIPLTGKEPAAVEADQAAASDAADPRTNSEKQAAWMRQAKQSEARRGFGSAHSLALPLFGRYVLAFELAAILILVAVLGAVVLSKRNI
jgi:NADH:ubiquinone oxidoreductase subunit 6 (subunit J)